MSSCRDYERLWKNPFTGKELCVDRNLEDDWLRRLNHLRYLDLRSICEGHPGVEPGWSQKPQAMIKLSLKEGVVGSEDFISRIQGKASKLFAVGDTKIDVQQDSIQGRLLSAWIDHSRPRRTAEMDDTTRSWFTRVVGAAERFDQFIHEVLYEIKT